MGWVQACLTPAPIVNTIVQWNHVSVSGKIKGGHFAAWEVSQLFAEEMRAAFRSLR
jgi:hypothetical protein